MKRIIHSDNQNYQNRQSKTIEICNILESASPGRSNENIKNHEMKEAPSKTGQKINNETLKERTEMN